ncbi:MAG TPA: ferritin-like domain-containing protein [Thermomicrobiales bacterium]|nr:ferritin-like domain-containing protein [Thermomicrobiales bacterium]
MVDAKTKELIDGLNRDLAAELGAVIQYTTYAAVVTGAHRPALVGFFQGEIVDELRHAQFLANKIAALGGTPTTTPEKITIGKSNRELLEAVLEAETRAIKGYGERVDQAEAIGDIGLKVQLEDQIRDETEHREETLKLLRDTQGGI